MRLLSTSNEGLVRVHIVCTYLSGEEEVAVHGGMCPGGSRVGDLLVIAPGVGVLAPDDLATLTDTDGIIEDTEPVHGVGMWYERRMYT